MHVLFLFTILYPDYANSNLYSHIFSRLLLGVFLNIAVINTVINKYFGGVLGGMGNNLNIVVIYSFLYAGTRFFKG